MSKRTYDTLLGYGADTSVANVISAKFTISRLKLLSKKELQNMGLIDPVIDAIFDKSRPPIPKHSLHRLLFLSAHTCCICRQRDRPIVIHHISPWATSRSHDESNLVVLCLICHDRAHSKKSLSLNLTSDHIRNSKRDWQDQVAIISAQTILELAYEKYFTCDYINLTRLFEATTQLGIRCSNRNLTAGLQNLGLLDEHGLVLNKNENLSHFTNFGDGLYLTSYVSNLASQVIERRGCIDITEFLQSPAMLASILRTGDKITLQAPFTFSDGIEESRIGTYSGFSIRIKFTFDPFYCTSISAKSDLMSSKRVVTVFGTVKELVQNAGETHILLSCLCVSSGMERHWARQVALEKAKKRLWPITPNVFY